MACVMVASKGQLSTFTTTDIGQGIIAGGVYGIARL